jgi:hypothetical protein
MDYRKLKLLCRAAALVASAVFVWGFLVPTLMSGGDFAVLMGVGAMVFLTLAIVIYGMRLWDELKEEFK